MDGWMDRLEDAWMHGLMDGRTGVDWRGGARGVVFLFYFFVFYVVIVIYCVEYAFFY